MNTTQGTGGKGSAMESNVVLLMDAEAKVNEAVRAAQKNK